MTSNGRIAKMTALALATGTLVAAGAGTASAATNTKNVFNAAGGGSVLHLELNLPAAIPGVTDASGQLAQDLIMTGSNVRTSSFTDKAAAVTKSILGANGNIPVVSQLLEKSLTAEYGTANPASVGTFPANPLISGGVLQLTSTTANPDVAGTVAHSLSSVANLRIEGAGNLQAVLDALTAQLTTVLNGVVGTLPSGAPAGSVAGVTTTVTDLLGSVVTQLNTATNGAAQPVKDAVDAVIAQLNALPTLLAAQIKAKTADTALLSVKLIESEQTVSRTADVVTSTATNKLTGISALGGLITVEGMTSDASASLGKSVTDAAANGTSSVLKVNVADLLSVDVTGGLTAALGGTLVPTAVKDAVNAALATVTGVLNTALGATLTGPVAGTPVKSADKASSNVAAAHLRIQPIGFAKPLVDLALVPASAEITKVSAQQVTTPAVVTPPATVTSLPRTGGAPLVAGMALGLMGLAMVARRRRLAHLAD